MNSCGIHKAFWFNHFIRTPQGVAAEAIARSRSAATSACGAVKHLVRAVEEAHGDAVVMPRDGRVTTRARGQLFAYRDAGQQRHPEAGLGRSDTRFGWRRTT